MGKTADSTVPFSARISSALDFQLRQRAAREGRTLTEIHQESLRAYLASESLPDQLARFERGLLPRIFAVVSAVAGLSEEERRVAKTALRSILAAEVGK
jgi:hypothetical protein